MNCITIKLRCTVHLKVAHTRLLSNFVIIYVNNSGIFGLVAHSQETTEDMKP